MVGVFVSAPRPSEVKAVAALLEAGAESPEALAKAVIRAVDDARRDRVGYAVLGRWNDDVWVGYGPFPTRKAARRSLDAGRLPLLSENRTVLAAIYSPEHGAEALRKADERE